MSTFLPLWLGFEFNVMMFSVPVSYIEVLMSWDFFLSW
jgi:hypothetical protein